MDSKQGKFHKVFEKMGGIFDTDMLDGEAKKLYSNIRSKAYFAVNMLKGDYPNLPPITIDFIINNSLNAVVTKNDDEYYIGLNTGTCMLLLDIYNKMLSTDKILPHIGDISKEITDKHSISSYWDGITTFDFNHFQKTAILPEDEMRRTYAQYYMDLAITFLIFHECGHIIRGHVDYGQSLKQSFWAELDSTSSPNVIDSMTRQTLEMDADSFATNRSYILASTLIDAPNLDELHKMIYSDWNTFTGNFIFSVYSLLRLFGFSDIDVKKAKLYSHPPAAMRISMIADNIPSIFGAIFDPSLVDSISETAVNNIVEAEKAFVSITFFENEVVKYVDIYTNPELDQYKIDILNNWSHVRPFLMPFAFGNLPKA